MKQIKICFEVQSVNCIYLKPKRKNCAYSAAKQMGINQNKMTKTDYNVNKYFKSALS